MDCPSISHPFKSISLSSDLYYRALKQHWAQQLQTKFQELQDPNPDVLIEKRECYLCAMSGSK